MSGRVKSGDELGEELTEALEERDEARGMVRDVVNGRPLPMVIRCTCKVCLAKRKVEFMPPLNACCCWAPEKTWLAA